MAKRVSDETLDTLFNNARAQNGWLPKPVSEGLLREVYALARMGPTSANCSPMRIVFVTTEAGKERLKPALSSGNRDKTLTAPVTAIIAHDMRFYDELPRLFPRANARVWFTGNDAMIEITAMRNGTLQGGYFMMAARALGLDVGPMSGFNNALVDAEFFPDGRFKSNFLCSLGYGDPAKLFPRDPRLEFEEACTIV